MQISAKQETVLYAIFSTLRIRNDVSSLKGFLGIAIGQCTAAFICLDERISKLRLPSTRQDISQYALPIGSNRTEVSRCEGLRVSSRAPLFLRSLQQIQVIDREPRKLRSLIAVADNRVVGVL